MDRNHALSGGTARGVCRDGGGGGGGCMGKKVTTQESVTKTQFALSWKKGKDPHLQDKIQHLDFTKDPSRFTTRPLPCAFYHKNVLSKAVFGP